MLVTTASVLAACGMPIEQQDSAADGAQDGSTSQPDAMQSQPDAMQSQPDAMQSQPDATMGGNCPASAVDAGLASDYMLGAPRKITNGLYVVRDAMGFYALTSLCPHRGCEVNVSRGGFICPCHSATFDINGAVTGGPTSTSLVHYAMCVLGNGQLGVDMSRVVAPAERFNP